jgi:hypothetical protein
VSFLFTKIPVVSQVLSVMAVSLVGVGLAALGTGALLGFVNFGLKNLILSGMTWTRVCRLMTVVIGGLSRALLGLRVAMFAIPGWGWALAGLAAVGGIAAYMMSMSGKDPKSKKSGIKRDPKKDALGGDVGVAAGNAQARSRGESIGTFAGIVASQLGIGPALTAQEATAENTGRIADGMDELVGRGGRMPKAAALRAGMDAPGIGGKVAAVGDRDLLSVSERSALAAEQQNVYLRQLVEMSRGPGLAFV